MISIKVFKPIIKREAFYFVGSPRIYRTSYSAAKGLAWKMITDKHRDFLVMDCKDYMGLSCECGGDWEDYDTRGCALHNHQNGYFKRLSVKLIKIILLRYINA